MIFPSVMLFVNIVPLDSIKYDEMASSRCTPVTLLIEGVINIEMLCYKTIRELYEQIQYEMSGTKSINGISCRLEVNLK